MSHWINLFTSVFYTKPCPAFLVIFLRVKATVVSIIWPCFLTSFTTILKFGASVLATGDLLLLSLNYEICSCLETLYLIVFTPYLQGQSFHYLQVLLNEPFPDHPITQWNLHIWYALSYSIFLFFSGYLSSYILCNLFYCTDLSIVSPCNNF